LISRRRQFDIGLTDATRLPPEDHEALRSWLDEFVRRKQDDISKMFATSDRASQSIGRRGFQSQVVRLVFSITRDAVPDDQLEALVTDGDIERLSQAISAHANQILNDQDSRVEKIRLIFRWVSSSYVPRVSDDELRRFSIEELNDQQREIIYRLGPEEGRHELIRLYRESRQRRWSPRSSDGERRPFSDEPRERPDRGPPRDDRGPPRDDRILPRDDRQPPPPRGP
jgi:hypothetical protein